MKNTTDDKCIDCKGLGFWFRRTCPAVCQKIIISGHCTIYTTRGTYRVDDDKEQTNDNTSTH